MKLQKLVKILNQKRRPKMKMTPEQKAFYEYGKARGILKEVRFQMISMEYDEKRYHKLSKAICDAWQKRAACRAWVHPMRRRCSNCKHELTQYKWCTVCANEGLPIYWEPRKEGE